MPADNSKGDEKPESRKFTENPDLPSPEVMTHLLNLHFTYVHPFAPVFVWSKFLKRLKDRDYSPSFLFLLNSIFALASRYSDDISFRTDPAKSETVGVRFAEKAKEILDTLYDSPDRNCVGALVLLAFQQMGTGSGYRAWMYVGISIRMAQHLGLNRDCLKLNPHMSAIDREERNRIWWTCFMADRIMSTSFGRPQGINEHDVDATYPEGIDEENIQLEYRLDGATSMLTGPSPHSEQNFVFMASLMRILGRVMVSLYSPRSKASSLSTSSMTNPAPLEQLDKELTDWLLTLPPHLQFRSVQQEPGTFVCTLHMTFYAVLILLHRPYSHRSSHKTSNDPSISLSICTSAANNTIEMASNMMRAMDTQRGVSRLKGMLHSSVFIFFTAGIVHITNCTSTDPVLAASAKLRTIETLKCLAMVEDVWITGRWCANNIAQLLKARNIVLPCSPEGMRSLCSIGKVVYRECSKKKRLYFIYFTNQPSMLPFNYE
ncbi:fungal-specific transcription factor domain-containing protein [Linnemannia elongata]|nr:fungal-specific transcription factor domain-containing protein [Linnemannia elongata]